MRQVSPHVSFAYECIAVRESPPLRHRGSSRRWDGRTGRVRRDSQRGAEKRIRRGGKDVLCSCIGRNRAAAVTLALTRASESSVRASAAALRASACIASRLQSRDTGKKASLDASCRPLTNVEQHALLVPVMCPCRQNTKLKHPNMFD